MYFLARGCAIGKGINFPDVGIRNGINFDNFCDFGIKHKDWVCLFEKLVKGQVNIFAKLV